MRIAFFDIETTDLRALMGRVLCCSFLPYSPDPDDQWAPYTFRGDARQYKGRSAIDDSKLVDAIRNELEKYNMIVGWNSKLFDVPFVNARLMRARKRPFSAQLHLDLMWYAGGSSTRVGSRKLVNVQKYLGVDAVKTDISWDDWQLAGMGDTEAFNNVVEHCEADVRVLADVYPYLIPYVKNIHK